MFLSSLSAADQPSFLISVIFATFRFSNIKVYLSYSHTYNEKELLQRISQGEADAFRTLLDLHHKICYQVVLDLTRDRFVAEDLVQEVFLKVWLRRETIHEVENFGGWLRTVSVHTVYKYIVRAKKEKFRDEKWWHEMGLDNQLQDASEQESYFQELLSLAFERLTPRQKETFNLVKKQGFTREEAAKQLGISVETVKTNLERAMKSIRAYCLGRLDDTSIMVIFSIVFTKYI